MISFRYFFLGIPYNQDDCENYSKRVERAREIIINKRCFSSVFGESIDVDFSVDLTWVFDKCSVSYPLVLTSLRYPFSEKEREQAECRAELRLGDLTKRLVDFSLRINSRGEFKDKSSRRIIT